MCVFWFAYTTLLIIISSKHILMKILGTILILTFWLNSSHAKAQSNKPDQFEYFFDQTFEYIEMSNHTNALESIA
jgi:hypothetical protein